MGRWRIQDELARLGHRIASRRSGSSCTSRASIRLFAAVARPGESSSPSGSWRCASEKPGPFGNSTSSSPLSVAVRRWLVLQPHFVVFGLSSLVVAGFRAVLVAPAPVGPGPLAAAVVAGGDQVCQETLDLAKCERYEAAARAFGAIAAVTAR